MSEEIYTVRRVEYNHYRVVKFDSLLNVTRVYEIKGSLVKRLYCECYEGSRHGHCRHHQVIILFERTNRTSKGWFFDWNTRKWELPIYFQKRRKGL